MVQQILSELFPAATGSPSVQASVPANQQQRLSPVQQWGSRRLAPPAASSRDPPPVVEQVSRRQAPPASSSWEPPPAAAQAPAANLQQQRGGTVQQQQGGTVQQQQRVTVQQQQSVTVQQQQGGIVQQPLAIQGAPRQPDPMLLQVAISELTPEVTMCI